jgi:hypothetical protein
VIFLFNTLADCNLRKHRDLLHQNRTASSNSLRSAIESGKQRILPGILSNHRLIAAISRVFHGNRTGETHRRCRCTREVSPFSPDAIDAVRFVSLVYTGPAQFQSTPPHGGRQCGFPRDRFCSIVLLIPGKRTTARRTARRRNLYHWISRSIRGRSATSSQGTSIRGWRSHYSGRSAATLTMPRLSKQSGFDWQLRWRVIFEWSM